MTVTITELEYKLEDEPFIMGADQQAKFSKILSVVYSTRFIHDFLGDPGTGKTHMLEQIGMQYGRMKTRERMADPNFKGDPHCPVFYTTVDEEMMKSSLLAGKGYEDGNLKIFRACVGEAMYRGGIVIVDELTHGIPSIQLSFNSVGDNKSKTSIGDLMLKAHKDFRLLTGHNMTATPGNNPIMISTGSRMICWPFYYPEAITETKIAKSILRDQIGLENIKCPDAVLRYLVAFSRDIREKTHYRLPVSARNVAAMGCLLSLFPLDTSKKIDDKYNEFGSASEPIRKMIAERVMFGPIKDDSDLHHPQVNQVLLFVSQFGEEEFREVVRQCSMYYLDLEGVTKNIKDSWQAMIADGVI